MKLSINKSEDWCHLCGDRSEEPKVDVNYPSNAEHLKVDTEYLRICRTCIQRMYNCIHFEVRITSKELVEWFNENYKDPADGVPFESAEGGYQFVNGGPYDAEDEIRGWWANTPGISEDVIEESIDQIDVNTEWVKTDEY